MIGVFASVYCACAFPDASSDEPMWCAWCRGRIRVDTLTARDDDLEAKLDRAVVRGSRLQLVSEGGDVLGEADRVRTSDSNPQRRAAVFSFKQSGDPWGVALDGCVIARLWNTVDPWGLNDQAHVEFTHLMDAIQP